MNLVFKWSTLALAAISSWANANEDQQCANLSFQQSEDYVIDIAAVDSKPVEFNRTAQQIRNGAVQYQIAPGEHAITFIQYPVSFFKADRFDGRYRQRTKDFDALKMKVAYIKVAADHNFQVGLTENSENAAFKIIAQQQQPCIVDSEKLLGKSNSLYVDNEPLPSHMEQSLLDIMMRLNHYHQNTINTQTNVMPIKTDGYFGAVIDDKYTNDGQIKVLSILPFSLAANIGLKSGDVISQLGEQQVDQNQGSARELFNEYIKSRGYQAELKFQVLRNGAAVGVTGENRVPIIPGSNYFLDEAEVEPFEIINTQKIDSTLEFDYERQILALQRYYESKGINADHIRLTRAKSVSKSLGLKGKALRGKGLLVSAVESNSPLSKLGVKAGDIIVSGANKALLTDSVKTFLSEVQNWQPHQKIFLSVMRTGDIVELSGVYQPDYIPAFSVMFDMHSEKYIQQAQDKPRNRFVRDSIIRVVAERENIISMPASSYVGHSSIGHNRVNSGNNSGNSGSGNNSTKN